MYSVYILLCADGSLYTGMTSDVQRRFEQHKAGKASHYTRSHKVKKIAYQEQIGTRGDALKREAVIKKMSRVDKLELIKQKKKN
ncbi:MAG: GIY-YIG nuclease family protein [bacterium]|nr:GIY-YIG nuclease family protein [bacterium]